MAKKTPKLPKPPKPPEPEPPPSKPKRGTRPDKTSTPPNGPSTEIAQKPRVLVAPSSWTGKLPVTLLHEHCQKAGWNKVDYSMVITSERWSLLTMAEKRKDGISGYGDPVMDEPQNARTRASAVHSANTRGIQAYCT